MIFNSFVTQIGMAVIALGIIFTYVQPTFTKIGTIQETIEQYKLESSKVSDVTTGLSTLVSKINDIPTSDLKALLTYIPDSVDHVSVSRDLLSISQTAEVYLESVKYDGVVAGGNNQEAEAGEDFLEIVRHTFTVSVTGSYEQTKLFLSMLEQNNYPLEVHSLKMTTSETGLIQSDMKIVTYSNI